jgi:hypothetical protein
VTDPGGAKEVEGNDSPVYPGKGCGNLGHSIFA